VILWESLLGLRYLTGTAGAWVVRGTIATLVLFCVVLVRLLADPLGVGCGCLGVVMLAERAGDDARMGLVRNAGMLWIAVWLLRTRPGRGVRAVARPAAAARGFTLIEMMLVISVVALLVSLSLPVAAGVRARGKMSRSLATHQQLLQAVSLYAGRYREAHPYFATPGNPFGPQVLNGKEVPDAYFSGQSRHWASLIVPEVYETRRGIELRGQREYLDSIRMPPELVRTQFFMTHTAFAAPAYWRGEKAPGDFSLFRGTRLNDVQFPASKGMLLDVSVRLFAPSSRNATGVVGGSEASVGKADGSAAVVVWKAGEPGSAVERPFGAIAWPVLSTPGGLAGRDF
jgi:prepilin-type N-terminal cleavage/methylation domain-containing protein